MNNRIDREDLMDLINACQTATFLKMLGQVKKSSEAAEFLRAALGAKRSRPELINAALRTFEATHQNKKPHHADWVDSLVHFVTLLWDRRMTGWIKRLSEITFKGAIELKDTGGAPHRLVFDFADLALWNDKPEDFGITQENSSWMNWDRWAEVSPELTCFARERIGRAPFACEKDMLIWQIHPRKTKHSNVLQAIVKDLDITCIAVGRLQEIGELDKDLAEEAMPVIKSRIKLLKAVSIPAGDCWQRKEVGRDLRLLESALSLCKESS